jgi:hypothetical protein
VGGVEFYHSQSYSLSDNLGIYRRNNDFSFLKPGRFGYTSRGLSGSEGAARGLI